MNYFLAPSWETNLKTLATDIEECLIIILWIDVVPKNETISICNEVDAKSLYPLFFSLHIFFVKTSLL